MKYTLHQFQQKACFDLNLDLTEAYLLSWLSDFMQSGRMESILIDEEPYYWVSYQTVIDELPMLHITNKEIIGRRLKKLQNKKILKLHFVRRKQDQTKMYFSFVKENYSKLFMQVSTEQSTPYRPNGSFPIDRAVDTLSTEQSCNSSISDTSNNKNSSKYNVDNPDNQQDNKNKQEYYELTDLLINNLCDFNRVYQRDVPKLGTPAYEKWVDHIRKLVELDEKSITEIKQVLEWVHDYVGNNGFFWQQQIRSTAKLREKYNQLKGQMDSEKRVKRLQKPKDKGESAGEELRRYLEEKKKNPDNEKNVITIE